MTSNELRIGNLARDKVSKTELKVVGLTENNVVSYVIDRSKFPLANGWAIEPLPLNEEHLLKFGFEKIKDFDVYTNVWELKGFMVSLGEYINIHVDWADDGTDNYHSIVCYEELHVHTLQNLYFALVGEELTFKSE